MNIRKILSATIAAAVLLAPSFVLAATETVDGIGWTYSVTNGEATIGTGEETSAIPSSTSGDIVVPSSLGGCRVTSIGDYAFQYCDLTSVTIPDSVTSIGREAFYGCWGLTSVTIPDSVTSIGDSAFEGCWGLTSVTIPDSVTSIGIHAFSYCDGLTSIVVNAANPVYDSRDNCNAIIRTADNTLVGGCRNTTIPGSVTAIGYGAFCGYSTLMSVTIPGSITNIGDYAFNDCSRLTSVTIPASVTSIGARAFCWCLGLTSVTIPASVTSIGEDAFEGCEELTSVTIPYALRDVVSDWDLPDTCEIIIRDTVSLAITTDANLPEATEGVAYSTTLAAHGGTAPYTWLLAPSYGEQSQASTFAAVGAAQGWNEDDDCWTLDLPFAFPFYGGVYSQVRVNSNGTINFDGSSFVDYCYDESEFLSRPMIAVLWDDLSTEDGDIHVGSSSDAVTISWRCEYYDGGAVNASATLYPSGKIVLSYGAGNADGGFIGVSAGDGETQVVSAQSQSGAMANADDIVFVPAAPPAGMTLSEAGVLSGTPDEPGEYVFTVAVTDAAGETGTKTCTLVVVENPALRPTFSTLSPEPGFLNMGDATERTFSATASHPTAGAATLAWFLDGDSVGSGATYAYTRPDEEIHTIRVVASVTGVEKTTAREWTVGVMTTSHPASQTISAGMNTTLSVELTSSTPATVTWFDADTDDEVGYGSTLALKGLSATASYYAVAESALGVVTSAVATVTVDSKPAVGRIYKMTGPAFIGNRLVLRAKPYGDLSGATYVWKRDGVSIATTERLDISALKASDFGTYTLTVTNPYGTETSEAYALAPAPAGVPYGWGASDHGRTTAPEGLTGVAQVASGMNFNLALTTNGTVAAWGYNVHGGCNVPSGLSGVSFVAAGGNGSKGAGFAVKNNGSVVAWGQPSELGTYWDDWANYDEQTDQYSGDWVTYTNGYDTVATMPADLADIVQVSVCGYYALALKADGTVISWGDCNYFSRYDESLDRDVPYWMAPAGLADVVRIETNPEFALALCANGAVVAWGMGYLDAPEDLADVVDIAATTCYGALAAGFALGADGELFKWGDRYNEICLPHVSLGEGAVAIDAGDKCLAALFDDGSVQVWDSWNDYHICDVPDIVQGNALGIAAGGYHCTAILLDADGDTISDAEEALLGRDSLVWEPYAPVTVSGMVTIDGVAADATVALYDASGAIRAEADTDGTGEFAIEDVIPGHYFARVSSDLAADVWYEGVAPGEDAAPLDAFSDVEDLDFDLEVGQAPALAEVVAHLWSPSNECEVVDLPDGTQLYIDLWPATPNANGLLDLGEAPASHGGSWVQTADHLVTVAPVNGQTPAPCEVWDAAELETVEANPHFSEDSGSAHIVSEPAGAEVYIDYADRQVGTTPLTVSGLAVADDAHILLLKKEGYLRPRPIWFTVEADEVTEISVPLVPEPSDEGLSVAVASAVEGLDIYLDYLPTDQRTAAADAVVTIAGLDPASHSGDYWHSDSHSILLRGDGVAPILPRIVERPTDSETGLPVGGMVDIGIDPQTLWESLPFVDPDQPLTNDEVAELKNWLVDNGFADAGVPDDEVRGIAVSMRKTPAANPKYTRWDCFEAGLNPASASAEFVATVEFVNGVPVVGCDPPLGSGRRLVVYGRSNLGGGNGWVDITNLSDAEREARGYRFFKVEVRLAGEAD